MNSSEIVDKSMTVEGLHNISVEGLQTMRLLSGVQGSERSLATAITERHGFEASSAQFRKVSQVRHTKSLLHTHPSKSWSFAVAVRAINRGPSEKLRRVEDNLN